MIKSDRSYGHALEAAGDQHKSLTRKDPHRPLPGRGVCSVIPQEATRCAQRPYNQSPSLGTDPLRPQLFHPEGQQCLQHLPSEGEPTTLKMELLSPFGSFLFDFLPWPWSCCSPRYCELLLSYCFLWLKGSACGLLSLSETHHHSTISVPICGSCIQTPPGVQCDWCHYSPLGNNGPLG